MKTSFWFDLALALVLGGVPLYLVWLRYRWGQLLSRGLHTLLALVLVAVWVVTLYGGLVAPQRLVVREQSVTVGSGDSHLRLAVLSDTHIGLYRHADSLTALVELINALEPDAVVILGDVVDGEGGLKELFPLRKLETKYGAYAVLGNTDYRTGAVDVRRAIESQGVEVLTNEWMRLGPEGPHLAGLDDLWYGTPDWRSALEGLGPGDSVIMAVHNPDAANLSEYHGVDLQLSGHTHGGQVRLPGLGSLVPVPIRIGQRYDQGLFDYGQLKLLITSGAGESTARLRFFNPPEVVLLDVSY